MTTWTEQEWRQWGGGNIFIKKATPHRKIFSCVHKIIRAIISDFESIKCDKIKIKTAITTIYPTLLILHCLHNLSGLQEQHLIQIYLLIK